VQGSRSLTLSKKGCLVLFKMQCVAADLVEPEETNVLAPSLPPMATDNEGASAGRLHHGPRHCVMWVAPTL
jgi:hypothetical protein